LGKISDARVYVFALVLFSIPVFGGPVLVLKGPSEEPYDQALSGFRQVYPDGSDVSKKQFLARVRTDPPPLIVAIGRVSAELAHENAPTIPLVFVMVANPDQSGLKGTNIAGISMDVPAGDQLAHFKELLVNPNKPVAILYNPANNAPLVAEAQKAAPGLDLLLQPIEEKSTAQAAARIGFFKTAIGAIWVIPDDSFATKERFSFLVDETTKLHLPLFVTMRAFEPFVEKGALAAVVSDFLVVGRQCGELVKEIMAGKTKIGEVGIRPPVSSWQINKKTAARIDLNLPQKVLNSPFVKTYD
jgi:putative ABC transport system substrate-binding protein